MDIYDPVKNTLRINKSGRTYELSLDDDKFVTEYFRKITKPRDTTIDIVPLHELSQRELVKIREIASIPSVYKYIGRGEAWTDERVQELADWSEEDSQAGGSRKYYSWAIVIREPREIVGFIGIRPKGNDRQLRYFINPNRQRMGIASKAVMMAAKEYAQSDPSVPRYLWAMVRKDNTSSIRLLEKLGFSYEGVERIAGEQEEVFKLDLDQFNQSGSRRRRY